jgi:hypothetical protein
MLKWVFGADTGPFRAGLNDMRKQTTAFAGSMKGMLLGAIGFGAIMNGFRNLFVEMDRVQKLAIRFGESAESVQKVALAADLAGAPIETMAKALTVATRNANEAATGNKELAESFEKLGINAAEFIAMPMEQKILALSKTFQNGTVTGEQLALMMDVLGKGGGEMIPMLSQGFEELNRQFENTSTVSQETVDKIAAFNDAITSLKQEAQVLGGSLVAAFSDALPYLERFVNRYFDLFTGRNLSDEIFKDRMDAKNAPKENKPAGPLVEDLEAAADAQEKIEKDRKKLIEDIAKLEEESRIRALSLTEKILDAERQRALLAADSLFIDNENIRLEKQKEMLEVEKNLVELREQHSANQKRLDDEKQKAAEDSARRIQDLEAAGAEIDRRNAMAGMSDKDKLKLLTSERNAAMNASLAAGSAGDKETQISQLNRSKELDGEIASIMQGVADQASSDLLSLQSRGPTIATSSLADIGGGGGVRMMEQDYMKKQISLLEIIAANTAGGDQGSKPPEPIS